MAFVPSASAFSLPLPFWQQDPSVRVAKYESRKRKNQYHTGEESDNNGEDGETTDAVSEFGPTDTSVILSPEEVGQYRVAGLPFDEELPGGHFPHGPAKEENQKLNSRRSIEKQLSNLSPPLYAPQSSAHQGNLRLHHLSVLTSVLHRCLLDGDYIRAGKAWGLLIREQFRGQPIDVRAEDRWGIGAEILLRKDQQISNRISEGALADSDGNNGAGTIPRLLFTRKGFEDAKEYYETLIIQHPYQKHAPNAINELHFYPAMFGLWVYVTQEESAAARRDLDDRDPASLREAWEDEDANSENGSRDDCQEKYQRLTAGIRAKELAEAYRISARMDGLLTSPPYSDSSELLELRGMVSLWIADLLISSLSSGDSVDEDEVNYPGMGNVDDDTDVFMSTTKPNNVEARQERRAAMEKRELEIAKSKDYIDKAQQRKRGVTSKMQDLHIVNGMSSDSN